MFKNIMKKIKPQIALETGERSCFESQSGKALASLVFHSVSAALVAAASGIAEGCQSRQRVVEGCCTCGSTLALTLVHVSLENRQWDHAIVGCDVDHGTASI